MQTSDIFCTAHASLKGFPMLAMGGGVTVDFDLSFLIQFAAFLVLFLVIKPLLLSPFLRVMEERENRTDGARAQARAMDEKAGEIIKRYDTQLEKVRRVAHEERERLRSDGLKLETKILGEARDETARLVHEGKLGLAKEADGVRTELSRVASSLATEVATRVLGREVR